MIPNKLSQIAEDAAVRHEQMTDMFQVLFSRAMSGSKFSHAGTVSAVVAEAVSIAMRYLQDEQDRIARALEKIAVEAQGRVRAQLSSIDADELSDAALAHLELTQSYLADEIAAQTKRDIATLRLELQRATLEVSMIARTRQVTDREALWIYRMNHPETLDFHFRDRAARRTPSRAFARTVWRSALLSAYNEIVAMTIVEHGLDRAVVLKFEDGVEKLVDEISLSGDEELLDYAAAAATYFHPNANTYLDVEANDV